MVIIYTTVHCPYCKMAKEYLNKIGVNFIEKDVEYDSEALMEMEEKSGQLGVPVLDINDEIIVGFDREIIDEALNK